MLSSKRRPGSTQAVSREVEGIEPRKRDNRKDDGVRMHGSQHWHNRDGEDVTASSGSKTMACETSRLHGNPGGPAVAYGGTTREVRGGRPRVCQTTAQREGGKISGRESDRLIVRKKAGNAAGGKETTDGQAE